MVLPVALPGPLTPVQRSLINQPLDKKIFLRGLAGTGKTTAGTSRLVHLLENGVPGNSILVFLPQRTLGSTYLRALHEASHVSGGSVTLVTVGGLAQRMTDLFWPLFAKDAGFTKPDRPPVFLTLETTQYYMARLVRPLLDQGYFNSITIDRNRLYSQIIDNLNKAAVVGFPYSEIGDRLKSAWTGDPSQIHVYEDAQACANLFRQYCLDHNLLDFSLQYEFFIKHLWTSSICRNYLTENFQTIIFDNIEEDASITHDLLKEWLPHCKSALIIFDENAGYRRFLGANPDTAQELEILCDDVVNFTQSFIMSKGVHGLRDHLGYEMQFTSDNEERRVKPGLRGKLKTEIRECLEFKSQRYFPSMLDWVADKIAVLVHENHTPPGEIVVLAPFLSDALRFSLSHRLERLGIPSRSHRPSRSLREEPVTQCLLTLAILAHPQWIEGQRSALFPTRFDVAYALVQAIEDMDLVRAQLLAEVVYRVRDDKINLSSFDGLVHEMQERITYRLGERYNQIHDWLESYRQGEPLELDQFLSRLFGEVLSQPGLGFHGNYSAGEVTANLIESIQKFRWVAGDTLAEAGISLGLNYLEMVQDGVIAAQYIRSWQPGTEDTVYLAPAYTFLMTNRAVDYQFWLDVGSRGWSERLYQPVTQPYVLNRNWPVGRPWTDLEEEEVSRQSLFRLTTGLLQRCRKGLFLGLSELGEQGYEQRGPLLNAFQRVLRKLQ